MNKQILLISLYCIISLFAYSQKPWELGAEYQRSFGQGYQKNMIGGRYETYSVKHSWTIGVTYNLSSKKTYSQYRGFGIYGGYRYGFGNASKKGNAFAGTRVNFSFENFEGKAKVNGLSITPTAELGYHLIFAKRLFTSPCIGAGYTLKMNHINNSLQEDEGLRFIPGISAGYRF
jgi:hypothetical protein